MLFPEEYTTLAWVAKESPLFLITIFVSVPRGKGLFVSA
jgi:hypothetical protein